MVKCTLWIVLQYLVDLCQSVSSVSSRQHLRSANRGLLVMPRYCLSSYGRRAFSVAGPAIWNWLPDSMRERPSAETPSDVHWRHFYFQLTCVHSALELSGQCTLQIYLLTYLLTSDDSREAWYILHQLYVYVALKRFIGALFSRGVAWHDRSNL